MAFETTVSKLNAIAAAPISGDQGQPGWMHGWFQFWINLQHPYAHFFAYATAVIETVIALALIFGFARKYLYIIGALFSLTI